GIEGGRERLGRLCLPNPGLALEQHRLLERKREEERGRQPSIGQVVRPAERGVELVDRAKTHARSVHTCLSRSRPTTLDSTHCSGDREGWGEWLQRARRWRRRRRC